MPLLARQRRRGSPGCFAGACREAAAQRWSYPRAWQTDVCSPLRDVVSLGSRDTGHHQQERHPHPHPHGQGRGVRGHMLHRRRRAQPGLCARQRVRLLEFQGEGLCQGSALLLEGPAGWGASGGTATPAAVSAPSPAGTVGPLLLRRLKCPFLHPLPQGLGREPPPLLSCLVLSTGCF